MSTPTAAGTLEYAAHDLASARTIPNVLWCACLFYGLFGIAAAALASFVTLRMGYPLPLAAAMNGVFNVASRSDSLDDFFRGDTGSLVTLSEFVAAIAMTGAGIVRRRWTSAARALAIAGAMSLIIAACAANGPSIGAALSVLAFTPTTLIGRGGGEVWLTLDRLLDSTAFCVIVITLCTRAPSSRGRRRLVGALLVASAAISLVAGWHTFDFRDELHSIAFVVSRFLDRERFLAGSGSPSIHHGLLFAGGTVQAIVLAAGIAMWFGTRRWRSWATLAGCISLAIAIAAIAAIMLSASLNLTGRDFAVRLAPLRFAWQVTLGMEWAKFTVVSMLAWWFVLAVAREPAPAPRHVDALWPMIAVMSTQAPPLAYAPHADPIGHAVWTGLRVATVAWAATIVVRHLAYWSAVAVPGPGMETARGLAMAEAAVLAAMAIVAVIARVATPSRVRTLAILGAVVIALSLVGFAIDLSRLPAGVSGEKVGRIVWMAATRLQVQALPIAWIVATFARR